MLISRFVSIFYPRCVVLTQNTVIGGGSYIFYRAIFGLSQSLWFAYAISTATRRSRMATAAWLEIAFREYRAWNCCVGRRRVGRQRIVSNVGYSFFSSNCDFIPVDIYFLWKKKKYWYDPYFHFSNKYLFVFINCLYLLLVESDILIKKELRVSYAIDRDHY